MLNYAEHKLKMEKIQESLSEIKVSLSHRWPYYRKRDNRQSDAGSELLGGS